MNHLTTFPEPRKLMEMFPEVKTLKVNAHVHTPYSFSAFTDIARIFTMAQEENIAAVGINDFFVTDGYPAFYHGALNAGVFPLFNIEFIGLLKREQQQGIRINDPGNPGRCYFCGKGLQYPFHVNQKNERKLRRVVSESQRQVKAMIYKANVWFATCNSGIELSYNTIRERYAQKLVRERHIAKAVRIAVMEKYGTRVDQLNTLTRIFNEKQPIADLSDIPGIENEIRGNLLKVGGRAFVEEDETAFMSLEEITEIILDAGGIPCYPVLLDDKDGNYTEFERDVEKLYHELASRNINCIELIPGRNDAMHIHRFVDFFHHKGFTILLGTEHNTPKMIPLTLDTRGHHALSENILDISYRGVCAVAAHQYLLANSLPGFTPGSGITEHAGMEYFVKLGNAVMHYYRQQS